MTNSDEPVPATDLYDRHAEAFADATSLEELPEELRRLLDSFVEALPRPRVLDAGCGPGRDVGYFAGRDLDPIGVDLAAGMLDHARAHNPGEYLRMDVRELAFERDRFDGVWCPATVFFVPPEEMAAALGEFVRVLRPDGVARVGFKLGDGRAEVEKWGATTVEYHVTEEQARDLLEAAGFAVESTSVNRVSSGTTFANFFCRLADGEA